MNQRHVFSKQLKGVYIGNTPKGKDVPSLDPKASFLLGRGKHVELFASTVLVFHVEKNL